MERGKLEKAVFDVPTWYSYLRDFWTFGPFGTFRLWEGPWVENLEQVES